MSKHSLGFHCHSLAQIEERIVGNALERGEFYNLSKEDLPSLKRELATRNLFRSIHAPLVKPDWYPSPPTWSFLCDVERDSRNRTFRMVDESLAHAEEIGAEYVIVHFPTPATDGEGESESRLEAIARKSCDQLAELSVKRKVSIHIEGLVNSPYLTSEFLGEALAQYPLQYCFDVGHMNLASQLSGFDLYEFAATMAPHVGSMHLWNSRGKEDYAAYRHIPVHPSQDPAEGWADVQRVLEILSPACPVIFESPASYPGTLGNHDYRDGVKWVQEILEASS